MASKDAEPRPSRLSSFSLYNDPPVTEPGLIKRQLDLELQLKDCLEQLTKAYVDTESLEKVEELAAYQLSCCGRISGHRLQLLRLRRSQVSTENIYNINLESAVELPHDLLLADDIVTMDSIQVDSTVEETSTSDNGMEIKSTCHPKAIVEAKADLLTDDALNAELTEMVETVVNKAIKNALVQLIEQKTTTSLDIHSPSSVDMHDEGNGIKEEAVFELKTTVKNESIDDDNTIEETVTESLNIAQSSVDDVCDEGNGQKDAIELKTTVENEPTDDKHTTKQNTTASFDIPQSLVDACDKENGEKEKDVIELENTVKNESTENDHTTEAKSIEENTMVARVVDDGQVAVVTSEEDIISQVTNPTVFKEEHIKFPPQPDTGAQNVARAVESITEEPVVIENIEQKNGEPVKSDEVITKDIKAVKEDSINSKLASDPTKEQPPIKCGPDDGNLASNENLPSTAPPAEIIQQPSDSLLLKDPIKESPVPSNGKKLVKTGNIDKSSSATSPANVLQESGPGSTNKTKNEIFHTQSYPNRAAQKAKSSDSHKAHSLDYRTSPSMDQRSKKTKTLKPGSSEVATVTPLGAYSTFEWDPTCLLEELYIDCKPISPPGVQANRLVVEMEKLPRNQLKKTIAKGWKKRYFSITSGNLYYYEDKRMVKALGVVKLSGAKVVCEDLVIKVTDKLNQTIAIRGKPEDTYRMHRALHLESVHPTLASVISPYPGSDHPVVIVDIGSCSVRAGFAQGEAYPRLFFPAVCSIVKDTDEILSCGLDALIPSARQKCEIVFPTRHKLRMDQETSVPIRYIHFFLVYIFRKLKVEPSSAKVIMTLPQNYVEKDKELLMEVLLENLSCEAACLLEQTILSLYSYGATSGIVVDIGDRTDIVPIVDGFKIESGVTKLKIGGATVTDSLRRLSTEYGLRYFSDVEFYAMRLIKEKIGFVSQDFKADLEQCTANVASYKRALEVTQYQLPDRKTVIAIDSPLFRSLEGFFQPSLWGKDIPSIPDLVLKAIQACDVDRRREMSRSIFLSGGATLTTGFQERLEQELAAIVPSSYTVQVQASVSRHHAAFLGAAVVASLDSFQDSWITKEDFVRLRI